jgi:hypothetical protein
MSAGGPTSSFLPAACSDAAQAAFQKAEGELLEQFLGGVGVTQSAQQVAVGRPVVAVHHCVPSLLLDSAIAAAGVADLLPVGRHLAEALVRALPSHAGAPLLVYQRRLLGW